MKLVVYLFAVAMAFGADEKSTGKALPANHPEIKKTDSRAKAAQLTEQVAGSTAM